VIAQRLNRAKDGIHRRRLLISKRVNIAGLVYISSFLSNNLVYAKKLYLFVCAYIYTPNIKEYIYKNSRDLI
jgi:hypothetical protein